MSEKKETKNEQLNNEKLEKVNGGSWFGHLLDSAKNTVKEAVEKAIEDDSSK